MSSFGESPESSPPERVSDTVASELEVVLKTVPKGAFALAGAALSLLLLAWLAVYFFVFLPRGPIS
jgi:asparagine N-glycosylation enzyme membrane subunit Stt3